MTVNRIQKLFQNYLPLPLDSVQTRISTGDAASGIEISLFHLLKAAYIKDVMLVWWKWNRNL
jgi:hypothetical protein